MRGEYYLELARLVVVAVDKGEPALVIIQVCTQALVLVDKVLRLLDNLEPVVGVKGTLVALLHTPLIPHPMEQPRAEHLALDAGGELVTFTRAGGAVLAVLAAVLTFLRLLALTLATLAGPVSRAQLVDELAIRGDASLVARSTLT